MSATDRAARSAAAGLTTWRDGAAKQAIAAFVEAARALPEEERVAVFDNDGTLWCEQPMPIQLDFILRRLAEMAAADAQALAGDRERAELGLDLPLADLLLADRIRSSPVGTSSLPTTTCSTAPR